jgi:hypothetical protein
MIISMRSTVIIDDDLFRRAKRRAADMKMTLSDVINQALRDALSRPIASAPPFEMPSYGDPAWRVHREPAAFAADEDDEAHSRLRR